MRFLAGFATGIVSTIIVMLLLAGLAGPTLDDKAILEEGQSIPGLNLFSEKGECLTRSTLTVFQTLMPNAALAQFGTFPEETLVLIVNYDGSSYYDDQEIKIGSGKCARLIGTYQYETKMEIQKTVPVVVVQ